MTGENVATGSRGESVRALFGVLQQSWVLPRKLSRFDIGHLITITSIEGSF
jgi:hypothetical protein